MDAPIFLAAAEAAEVLLASERVAGRWHEASALEGYTVGGLAGHLARAVLTVERYLGEDPPSTTVPVTDAAGYLVAVLASHDPVTSDLHATVRARGEQEGERGPRALVERVRAARRHLEERLRSASPDQLVTVLDGTVMPVPAYLETRTVELVVHLDDLAVSVGLDGPTGVPADAYEQVAATLAVVAARRGCGLATVRSLARRERHPGAVRAL